MMFQSTLPHGERRITAENLIDFIDVSIHAPTWGATTARHIIGHRNTVSIHAPTWGATHRRPR